MWTLLPESGPAGLLMPLEDNEVCFGAAQRGEDLAQVNRLSAGGEIFGGFAVPIGVEENERRWARRASALPHSPAKSGTKGDSTATAAKPLNTARRVHLLRAWSLH